jgi:hypothetical protein
LVLPRLDELLNITQDTSQQAERSFISFGRAYQSLSSTDRWFPMELPIETAQSIVDNFANDVKKI